MASLHFTRRRITCIKSTGFPVFYVKRVKSSTLVVYQISSNKLPWRLFNFKALMFDSYYRTTLKRGRCLFQRKKNCSYDISKFCHCLNPNNNK